MNLNVIRTLTIRSQTEGVAESTAALKGLEAGYEGVGRAAVNTATVTDTAAKHQRTMADAVSDMERQMALSARTYQMFSTTVTAANENQAKSWRAVDEAAQVTFNRLGGITKFGSGGTGWLGLPSLQLFEARLKELGLQGSVVTGMLKKTEDGFVMLQKPAAAASGSVGMLTTSMQAFTGSADPASQSVSNFTKMLAGISAAGIVIGTILAIRKAMDDVMALGDRAQDTRIDPTTLYALQAGAAGARVTVAELNSALDKFTEVSKKTEKGAKDFYQALRNIDPVFVGAFKSAPTQIERFKIFADAMSKARNEVQRYQLAMEGLNSDNDRLISMFTGGRAAIDAFIGRARELGIVVDEAFVKKMQESQAQFAVLATLLQQRLTVAVIDLYRAISELWNKSSSGLNSGLITSFTSFNQVVRDLAYNMSLLAQAWQAFYSQIGTASPDLDRVLDPLKEIFSQSGKSKLKRAIAVGGEEAGTAWADKFYDGVSTVFKKTEIPKIDVTPAFKGRPELNPLKETISAYERLIQATKDHTEEMQFEISTLGKSKDALYALKIQHDLLRAAKKSSVDTDDPRVRARIDEVAAAYARAKIQLERYKAIQADIINLGSNFLSGFSKDIASGVKPMEALANASKRLAESMIDIAAKAVATKALGGLFAGGLDFSGLIGAATTASGTLVAGTATASTALAVGGGIGGSEAAAGGVTGGAALAAGGSAAGIAMWGPIALLIAAIAALSFFSTKKDDKLEKAREAWVAMGKDIDRLVDKLSGNAGSVKAEWQDLQDQIDKFQSAAGAAEDMDAVIKVGNDLHKFQIKMAEDFYRTIGAVLQSWEDGFGEDSPFIEGMQHVKDVAEEVAKVLADIKFLYGEGTDTQTTKTSEAITAATKYLLSLITGTEELSELSKKLQEIRGSSYQLQTELEKLGYTSEQAAALISGALTKAIQKLVATFYDDLERKINESTGKDYLNKVKDLIKEIVQLFSDALELGLDATQQILEYYTSEIQKIVESSTEVTQAKQELIDAYNKEADAIKDVIAAWNEGIESLKGFRETMLSMIDEIYLSGLNNLERLVDAQNRFRFTYDNVRTNTYSTADELKASTQGYEEFIEAAKNYLEAIKEMTAAYVQLIQSFRSIKDTILSIIKDVAQSKLTTEQKLTGTFDDFVQKFTSAKLWENWSASTGGIIDPKIFEDLANAGTALMSAIDAMISELNARIAKLQSSRDAMLAYIDELQMAQLSPAALTAEMKRRFLETYNLAMGGDEDAMAKLTQDARNYIDALKAQADALQQTSDQLAGFIDSIEKFRESLKTDSRLSILSPGDQLAAAKAEFDRLSVLAQGGDLDAAAQLTEAGRKYLDLAKGYFASSEAYAAIYAQVDAILKQTQESLGEQKSIADEQLEAIKGQLSAMNEVIEALKKAAEKAATMIDYLKEQIESLNKLKEEVAALLEGVISQIDTQISLAQEQIDLLTQMKDEIVAALSDTVNRVDNVILWAQYQAKLEQQQLDYLTYYVSQFVDLGNNVKSVTDAVNNLKYVTATVLTDIFNEIVASNTGARAGGLVGMAGGGMVAGGIWNQDSVRAGFAGGGSIMLAGGEYVTTAPSVNAGTIGMLDQINRTGSVANDNGQHFEQLARTIARVASATTTAEIESNREEMRMLRAEVRNLGSRNSARERGTKVASG